ncbi:MAG: DUF4340 domain-containing protein [Leptospiraceae bacterium]|nr:DUF4340 domain-containing protein [Leptospiraceae bacterium]
MSWKKAGFLVLGVFVLFIAIFFTDEKPPERTDVNFWKIDFSKIIYNSPGGEVSTSFISEAFELERISIGLKENPIFLMRGEDNTSKTTYTYEVGFQVKNLFTELSNLNTKTMAEADEDIISKFELKEGVSPFLEFKDGDSTLKKMILGKENSDKSIRYALADGFLISIGNYIGNKFTIDKTELREKQYFPISSHQFKKLIFKSEKLFLSLENRFTKKDNVVTQNWFKKESKFSRLNPNTSNRLDSLLRGVNVDLYPDSKNGQGFAIIEELLKDSPSSSIEIEVTNGLTYKVQFYPRTNFNEKNYVPAVRTIEGVVEESPVYLVEATIKDLFELFIKIKEEPEWQDPPKKN